MADFNQSPANQTSSTTDIGPSLGFATSVVTIIPIVSVTQYFWTGGMSAGGATMSIGGGAGSGLRIYSRPLDGRLVPFKLPEFGLQIVSSVGGSSGPLVNSNFSSVSLLLHMDGSDGSTLFTDSSNANLTSTATNAIISTAQSKFGGASGSFDGSTAYLTVNSGGSSAFDLSAGDFTVEFFVFISPSQPQTFPILFSHGAGFANYGVIVDTTLTTISFFYGSTRQYVALGSLTYGAWTHIAISRNGTTLRVFANGVLQTTQIVATQLGDSSNMVIGAETGGSFNRFKGYIDEFRITKGVAYYTANFNVPTAAFPNSTDNSFSSVMLLLHCNGSSNSTTFNDSSSSARLVTPNGNSKISTTESKFGGASAVFDGSGDFLSASISGGLGSGAFTVEFWFYRNSSNPSTSVMFNSRSGIVGSNGIDIFTNGRVSTANNWIFEDQPVTLIQDNTWTHFALTRDGSNIMRRFFNGTQVGANSTVTNNFSESTMQIGGSTELNVGYMSGYLDDIRITVGTARYTTNFTPSAEPFPDS